MSSNPSESKLLLESNLQIQNQNKLKAKRERFVRSASFQKIIELNIYICSHNFFILPTSNAFVKTSHTAFKILIEKYIVFLKLLVVSALIQQEFTEQIKGWTVFLNLIMKKVIFKVRNSNAMPAIAVLMFVAHRSIFFLLKKIERQLFVLSLYLAFMLIFVQLGACIYVMSKVFLPLGLIFLVGCIAVISHIYLAVSFHYLRQNEWLRVKTKRVNNKLKLL